MGLVISKIFPKPKKITMVGLDAAGKTTIIYKLKLGWLLETIPTIGLNVETVKSKDLELNIFDLGGSSKSRSLWRHYYDNIDGVIFVVDSQDKERDELAAEELHILSSETAAEKPILIFANKQDLGDSMNLNEIERILHPHDLKQKNWHIQPCSAIKGDGLNEGFDWIHQICKK